MTNLDDLNTIKKLDTVNVLGSIEQLGNQCQQAWEEATQIQFPDSYRNINSVVFAGMGGSALGGYVIESLFLHKFTIPFKIINDYQLPSYVNDRTLVILASYSGTTEEVLSCMKDASNKKAQITGITVGGKLGEFFNQYQLPAYIFKPKFNPSNQPRMGTGYSVFGQIALFNALGLLSIDQKELEETISILDKGNKLFGLKTDSQRNRAKKLALDWVDKIPIVISAEFLTHVGRVIRNQIHESAKCFAAYHDLPELNHHLMEGLSNPKSNKNILRFLFLNSQDYSPKISARLKITQDVVSKQDIAYEEFIPQSKTKLAQCFESIQFGAYLNYYLALLYEVDPSKIPWVDYFKQKLKETS